MYEDGLGVERDYSKALQLYMQSARRGDVIAARITESCCQVELKGLSVPEKAHSAGGFFSRHTPST